MGSRGHAADRGVGRIAQRGRDGTAGLLRRRGQRQRLRRALVVDGRCDGARTSGLREKVAREFGWSLEEYERRLEPIFRVMDPAQYPARVDPASVLLFEAEEDTCISRGSREALCAAMGMPERYTIDANHRGAFLTMTPLYFNWLRHRVWEFFNHTLADEIQAMAIRYGYEESTP